MFDRWVQSGFVALFLLVAGSVFAAEEHHADESVAQQAPHQLVEVVTGQLLTMIDAHRDSFDTEPDKFFSALDCLLRDVIDFEWIAYRVMGSYGKQATPEQRTRFAEAFRQDLIETYGRGLVAYGEQSIVVLPPEKDINGLRRVKVVQEIRGTDGVFPLVYSMGLNRDGQWKVTNVVINGINLGKTFRNQFVQRAQKVGGDIDQVINNWSSSAG
jgi:phospholipid transport system substrate-binding protein